MAIQHGHAPAEHVAVVVRQVRELRKVPGRGQGRICHGVWCRVRQHFGTNGRCTTKQGDELADVYLSTTSTRFCVECDVGKKSGPEEPR